MHDTTETDYYVNQVKPLERTTLKFQASLLVSQRLQAEIMLEVLKAQQQDPLNATRNACDRVSHANHKVNLTFIQNFSTMKLSPPF